jgi:hypothetical protein
LGFDVLGVHHGHLPLGTSSTCLGLWLHLFAGFAGLAVDLVVAWQCWRNLYIQTDWCVCMSHFVEVTSLLSDASG